MVTLDNPNLRLWCVLRYSGVWLDVVWLGGLV